MKIGVQFPAALRDPAEQRALVALVEEQGIDSIWISEHVVVPDLIAVSYPYSPPALADTPAQFRNRTFVDPIATAGYIAGASQSLRIGVAVFILPLHNPIVLAKALATLDVLSNGRVIAGVGVGWLREEFDALGVPFDDRGQRSDEYLNVMRALWTCQPASFQGKFVTFSSVYCEPAPLRPGGPPVWIGGTSTRALSRCAEMGDGWIALNLSPEEFGQSNRQLDSLAAAAGRAPNSIERCLSRRFHLTPDSIGETLELMRSYARAGCQHIIVQASQRLSIDRFREEIGAVGQQIVEALAE